MTAALSSAARTHLVDVLSSSARRGRDQMTIKAGRLKKIGFLDSARDPAYSGSMPEISVHTTPDGRAYLRLGDGEVRDSVALGEHDEADRIPTLDSLVLHFDFYGRLTAIEVTGAVTSVLPPSLIDD
jgi:hypothetical protein